MNKNGDVKRLKRLLYNDYFHIPNGAFEVLKRDITSVLSAYFDLSEDGVILTVDVDDDGDFHIVLSARATAVKELKIL
ncbi:MAG: cell division topological specificity factor MinE [Clostridia bacterium]|nr:cell division topological specificity factor MinE [Clostridia bacterium]